MTHGSKGEQAAALIAALQTILDNLPDSAEADENGLEDETPPLKDPTHQLFVDRLDQYALASLFTSIRIIHNIHSVAK